MPAAISGDNSSAVAEVERRQDQALDLLLRHVAPQLAELLLGAQARDTVRPAEGVDVEEVQRSEGDVGRARG